MAEKEKEEHIENKQEQLMKLQMLEQQANQFGEQLKVIEQQIMELNKLKEDLDDLEKSEESEMFSEFGKGIFIKSTLKKELMVDVGSKILVPKSFEDVKGIIDTQIVKFNELKPEIAHNIESINREVDEVIGNQKE